MQSRPRYIAARDYHAHRACAERRAALAARTSAARRAHLALALHHEFAGYCVRLRRRGTVDPSHIGPALRDAYPLLAPDTADARTVRAITALSARPTIAGPSRLKGASKTMFANPATRRLQRWAMRRQRSSTLGRAQAIEADQGSARGEETSCVARPTVADLQPNCCS